jgi:hypothetical protein
MITIFELKNRGFCRPFCRTPFYIKNLLLLIYLVLFLGFVYLAYFRRDGLYLISITKILRGLNSEVYNYLQSNSEKLYMKPTMRTFSMSTLKLLSGNFFMAECIRLSKPCHLKEIAIGT